MALFSKKEKVSLDLQSISTLISEGSIFDGNLKAPSVARIDGQVTGDVMVDEGLILGEAGSIHGNVITKEMVVYGVVNGNIQTNSLEIKASGKVTGEIRTQTLTVENGAVYNGSLSMTQNNKLAQTNKLPKKEQKVLEVG
ncbi:polymer-forming cytoskeletal protein [Mucilaginibacter sp. BJC16-A38]|uniref:bactofilin family protein n=1 Tax=Mucilaginibacter phenanthrenivorans TaxID=1234842 RepID=UPI002157B9AF|nr:polymer-forming cytoskeletal protein [Mucilaginibacter phenanthrenivorans]MCR8558754.1 polymer-forming cytoskeletal protein [Mucilaginibacter phenanthrenivorans]